MQTVLAHIAEKPEVQGKIVCAQRPLPGDQMWQGASLGNGIYFEVGEYAEYRKTWE